MIETHLLSTTTTGRYLVEPAPQPGAPFLVGFHGYGQRAEHLLEELRRIPGAAGWTLVAVQALHRFYSTKTREVVGSWMTSLDRDQAIEDNISYVLRVVAELRAERGNGNWSLRASLRVPPWLGALQPVASPATASSYWVVTYPGTWPRSIPCSCLLCSSGEASRTPSTPIHRSRET